MVCNAFAFVFGCFVIGFCLSFRCSSLMFADSELTSGFRFYYCGVCTALVVGWCIVACVFWYTVVVLSGLDLDFAGLGLYWRFYYLLAVVCLFTCRFWFVGLAF